MFGLTFDGEDQAALKNDIDYATVLSMLREARSKGLTVPVILMGNYSPRADRRSLTSLQGYYNPLLAYGEEKAIQDARESGANGFIVVDLPPEEAVGFREKCTKAE